MAEIHADPEIQHGNPVIKGTRVPVYIIVYELAAGTSEKDILEGYPTLTQGDVALVIALSDCAWSMVKPR